VKPPVRVLIVEDSPTQCELLRSLLGEDSDIALVGEAHDGVEAVEAARRLRPDVVTMDMRLPRLGGLEAIAEIMIEAPARILVVCAVDDDPALDLSFRAVAAGALELIAKPRGKDSAGIRAWGHTLRESIHLMAEVPVVRRYRSTPRARAAPLSPGQHLGALGIVASTGGPPALAAILKALPGDLPVPIFIAQHVAPGFVGGLVRWLGAQTRLRVVLAEHGAAAEPGRVYLPPDEHDLLVTRGGRVGLAPNASASCPSANRLLASLAEVYLERAGGIVLTGMGTDGAQGAQAICDAGGVMFAQEEESCVVNGMPRAAVRAGARAVSLDVAAHSVRHLCGRS